MRGPGVKGDIAIDDVSYENCGVKTCDVPPAVQPSCGTPGIGQTACEKLGCCYRDKTCYQQLGVTDPTIVVSPTPYVGDESDIVTLMCKATSNPNPRYSWSRASGDPLHPGRATVMADGTLVIIDSSFYDSGKALNNESFDEILVFDFS